MAINENIVTGRKFRKLVDEANKLWQRISFWSKASDVEFDDGSNAETKLGAINGVTDSLTSTASNIAASAAAVKALNDKITELNSNLGSVYYLRTGTSFNVSARFPNDYQKFTSANFIVGLTSVPYTEGQHIRDTGEYVCGFASGLNLSKSYNAINGLLTIGGYAQSVGMKHYENNGQVGGYGSQSGTVFAYLVTGKII